MSLAHLNQESRNELERRVLAAALKQSLSKGDQPGAQLAHHHLTGLLQDKKMDMEKAQAILPSESVENLPDEEQMAATTSDNTNPEPLALSAVKSLERTVKSTLQLDFELPPSEKAKLNIDFELPPAEKAKMKAKSNSDAQNSKANKSASAASSNGDSAPHVVKAGRLARPTDNAMKKEQKSELVATTENQTIYGLEGDQMLAGIALPPFLTEPQVGLQYHALYQMLGVEQTASREDIHRTFLRLVRRILRELRGAKRPSRQELLGYLRKVWIAHDILHDPNTRTDYDFRDLGLRGTAEAEGSNEPSKPQSNKVLLRIGELLQASGLLEPAELEIACDMHKAMPELLFGTFLVRQGFIADFELDSVLFGQKALREGTISVAQFQVAMEWAREKQFSLKDALIEKGFATQSQLDALQQQTEPAPPTQEMVVPATSSPLDMVPAAQLVQTDAIDVVPVRRVIPLTIDLFADPVTPDTPAQASIAEEVELNNIGSASQAEEPIANAGVPTEVITSEHFISSQAFDSEELDSIIVEASNVEAISSIQNVDIANIDPNTHSFNLEDLETRAQSLEVQEIQSISDTAENMMVVEALQVTEVPEHLRSTINVEVIEIVSVELTESRYLEFEKQWLELKGTVEAELDENHSFNPFDESDLSADDLLVALDEHFYSFPKNKDELPVIESLEDQLVKQAQLAASEEALPNVVEAFAAEDEKPPAVTHLQISKAVPSWKDQLDWSAPEQTEEVSIEALAETLIPAITPDPIVEEIKEIKEIEEIEETVSEITVAPLTEHHVEVASARPMMKPENAAPSWKHQLDWEEVKENTTDVVSDAALEPEPTPGEPEREPELQAENTDTPSLEELRAMMEAQQNEVEGAFDDVLKGEKTEDFGTISKGAKETTSSEAERGLFSHMRDAASFYDAEEDFFSSFGYAIPDPDELIAGNQSTKSDEDVNHQTSEQSNDQVDSQSSEQKNDLEGTTDDGFMEALDKLRELEELSPEPGSEETTAENIEHRQNQDEQQTLEDQENQQDQNDDTLSEDEEPEDLRHSH